MPLMQVAWLVQRLIDWLTALATWYYNRKYGALASRLGGGVMPGDGRRGFLIVQIDGLAHRYLLDALARGATPYLQRLIEREGWRVQRWHCGLPSSTPAVQAGLLFGNNWDIPSFRWYEKESGQTIVCKVPAHLQRLQERLSAGRYGILTGGSSYFNLFDGHARTSFLTLSALDRQHFSQNVRGSFFFLLFLLTPRRSLRALWLSLSEYARTLRSRLHGTSKPGPPVARLRRLRASLTAPLATLLSPLAPVTLNVIFREIQTFAVALDIYRSVPSIYTDYYGYDDRAHHHGPLSDEALAALRSIDACIRELDQVRRQFRHRRAYDLFIFSDHGMSRCRPFAELFQQTLGDFVRTHVGQAVVDVQGGQAPWASMQDELLHSELQAAEARASPRSQRLLRLLRRALRRGLPQDPEIQADYDLTRRSDVIVRVAGSLAHIYFKVTPAQMDISEIAILYPDLLSALRAHSGFGLVLGREQGNAVCVTPRGVLRLDSPQLAATLPHLSDPQAALQQVDRLVRFPHSGDLVLLGTWYADGSVVGFEEHVATHGGLGGPQDYPFFITAPGVDWDLSGVTNATQLHDFFVNWYGDAATRAARGHIVTEAP
ncbi:MAG: alkaline phosphatase family protein [Anaerolineae bacterium]|uniref:alkaline phosphatase family protein n=1 Tax=Candidatus Amarolinea dominans TaxID=3140696 RepID=UPI0031357147|nr:alkaline phosphatase family protein [Anaerolineae bacterium]